MYNFQAMAWLYKDKDAPIQTPIQIILLKDLQGSDICMNGAHVMEQHY